MKLQLLNNPPWNQKFAVACSGGVDSMTALHFAIKGHRKPSVVFFDHGIPEDQPGLEVIERACRDNHLELIKFMISRDKHGGESQEEYWRKERYEALWNLDMPVITGHQLSDVMETWVFSCLNGMPKLIPYNTNNIFRPFMLNTKDELREWAIENHVEWHEDVLNNDLRFARCRIRHNIIPEALKINKGLGTMLKKKLIKKFRDGANDD